jgi:hypothetical protein
MKKPYVDRHRVKNYFREDQNVAMNWCVNRGIKIYPKPSNYKAAECSIEIWNNGTQTFSEEKYPKDDVATKIYELYCHFYDYNNANIS